jgi:hypothetical protein
MAILTLFDKVDAGCRLRVLGLPCINHATHQVANFDKTMSTISQNKITAEARDKKAKLESLGYSTSHLSSLEIDELLKRIEHEQSAKDWRSRL